MSDAERRAKELDSIIKRYNIRLDNENSELKRGLKEKGSNECETQVILAEVFAKRGDTVGATLHAFLVQKINDLLNTLD
jgi:sugar-specific transcriptional regulator TrmB